VISRESPIRVLFTEPMVEAAQLDTPVAAALFTFEPEIEGVAVWSARNQLEFRPAKRLPDGQGYAATVELASLIKDKTELQSFEFAFAAMRQSFDVEIQGSRQSTLPTSNASGWSGVSSRRTSTTPPRSSRS